MVVGENWKARPEYVNSKTGVWWDMDSCPVPDGYDARRVRPSIESALKDLGYLGPVTITAIGNLEKISPRMMRDLASIGILVKHFMTGRICSCMFDELLMFKAYNPAPATIMLISDKVDSDIARTLCLNQQAKPYNLLRAYTKEPRIMSLLYTTAEWTWSSLLAREEEETSESSTQEEEEKKMMFFCVSCYSTHPTAQTLTRHLSSKQHILSEKNIIKYRTPGQDQEEEDPDRRQRQRGNQSAPTLNY